MPASDRVRALLGAMTLEEKIAPLSCGGRTDEMPGIIDGDGGLDADAFATAFPDGVGQIGRLKVRRGHASSRMRSTRRWPRGCGRASAPGSTRRGVHGLMGRGATVFPSALAIAATWDPDLAERVDTAVAVETRARGGAGSRRRAGGRATGGCLTLLERRLAFGERLGLLLLGCSPKKSSPPCTSRPSGEVRNLSSSPRSVRSSSASCDSSAYVKMICSTDSRGSVPSLRSAGVITPERSPLRWARNTGTPARDSCSANTCSVLVLPVPVAPVTRPCRFSTCNGTWTMWSLSVASNAGVSGRPRMIASSSNPYPCARTSSSEPSVVTGPSPSRSGGAYSALARRSVVRIEAPVERREFEVVGDVRAWHLRDGPVQHLGGDTHHQ